MHSDALFLSGSWASCSSLPAVVVSCSVIVGSVVVCNLAVVSGNVVVVCMVVDVVVTSVYIHRKHLFYHFCRVHYAYRLSRQTFLQLLQYQKMSRCAISEILSKKFTIGPHLVIKVSLSKFSRQFYAPWFCSFRLWRFINHLLTYLLTYL